jgi:hypothetical protein
MEGRSVGKRGYGGAKEGGSSTGRVWVPGFHRVTARSRLARVLKHINRLFVNFQNVFQPR